MLATHKRQSLFLIVKISRLLLLRSKSI